MTLHYTLVFGLLVTEMIAFVLLILPLPSHWRKSLFQFISRSPLVSKIQYCIKIAFIFVFVLFIDSVNRLQSTLVTENADEQTPGTAPVQNIQIDSAYAARKFYSQRNIYLTGSTLILSLILNRTYNLILELLATQEAVAAAKRGEANDGEITQLKAELKELREKDSGMASFKEKIKKQAEEYEALARQRTTQKA
ncbi:B-cell receptor-associated protein 31-like-domain-containing protein [Umbelopsis sp. PMI_123]|nr:B-cell receptor-associated protein 31-like-domain-containing protein [Umbelopsis sp. PMI_123]